MKGSMCERRRQFGSRFLRDESKVFEHNAWDDVELSSEQQEEARKQIAVQKEAYVSPQQAEYLLRNVSQQWDMFYKTHGSKFFMNRNWLFTDFPELNVNNLVSNLDYESDKLVHVLDAGCGVGNTTIPLLQTLERSGKLYLYACDYSQKAIDILKESIVQWSENCKPFVWDITSRITSVIPMDSLDFVLCVYVLSALPPAKQQQAVNNLAKLLKPGGSVLLKDYAQFDMTQLRFKKNRLIDDNFYRRGDGTLVYFFSQDELDGLFMNAGLKRETNLLVRRLIVNRAKRIKMYRIWVQCKYVKVLLF
ncbi:unnamed protein product [Thelazia callipaeda]|uniref:tRNA N(3)-methylcytidine methyltransferase n=1 Tax=Thelazia callipaeda TaxID=103827 RepID=A0A0N5CM00_THECL|nr:unnamed protein product [Thelazia callipaeda]